MIDAFKSGGDFHSRTALGMFDKIKEAIKKGEVLIERTPDSDPNIPVLKDVYADERKKAKVMNFSVAYGKTAFGFKNDWNCTLDEAKHFINLWYSDRKEVEEW